ncbi:MAG: molybdopterin-dependent oxidoreductase [Thermodesulfobacteriota bacterium]
MIDRVALRRVSGTDKSHDRAVTTVCRECSVGCGLVAYVGEEKIVDVHGADAHPISRGTLCARGIAFTQGLDHPDRITVPAARASLREEFGNLESWDKALDLLADRLRRSRERHGPGSLLVGCDPEAGQEFYFCAKRFARLWGTPLVLDPFEEPMKPWPSELRSPGSACTQWAGNRVILLTESDLASTHPVAFSRLMQAQALGAKIIVADARFTRTMSKADMRLMIKPEQGNVFGTALMKVFLDRGVHRQDWVEAAFSNPEAWQDAFAGVNAAELAEAAGIHPDRLDEVASLMAGKGPVTLITAKKLAYRVNYRIWLTMATAMGWADGGAGGWYPLDAGRPPVDVTGDIEEGEEKLLKWLYGDQRALVKGMLDFEAAAGALRVKALIGSGNCLGDFLSPLMDSVPEMDVIAYFGSFPNATYMNSHIVFPATLWAETDGVCFSNDTAIQWADRIANPRQGCRSGLDFWVGLAQRFGWEEYFPWTADHCAFWDWLLQRSPLTSAWDVDCLKSAPQDCRPVMWSTASGSGERSQFPRFPTPDGRIEPVGPSAAAPKPVESDHVYPLYLHAAQVISRSRDASNWLPWAAELEPDSLIQMNPDVAKALGIASGDEVVVEGAHKRMEGLAWVNRMVPPWMLSSQRRFDDDWVLVHGKSQPREEALTILKELLQ